MTVKYIEWPRSKWNGTAEKEKKKLFENVLGNKHPLSENKICVMWFYLYDWLKTINKPISHNIRPPSLFSMSHTFNRKKTAQTYRNMCNIPKPIIEPLMFETLWCVHFGIFFLYWFAQIFQHWFNELLWT